MDIVRDIPYKGILARLVTSGIQCAGGFPLWLIGGADHYSDIDLYANNTYQFVQLTSTLGYIANYIGKTRHTWQFRTHDGVVFQAVTPGFKYFSDDELLEMADLSPSACLLTCKKGEWKVRVQYPEDVKNRICRVLIKHEFTDYRVKVYEEKGYQIAWNDL